MPRPTIPSHPYVSRRKSVCGGEPVIRGTRFPVRSVVEYVLRQGMAPEEMVREWSHLSLAQVYDALSYYHDHKGEVDALIRRQQPAAVRRKLSV
ncbi:MAG: DUF433 domain-containing protein [Planctomycetia bacterium]|nr:DUF433 domain-containing protein [Planctomycetia bacterium]